MTKRSDTTGGSSSKARELAEKIYYGQGHDVSVPGQLKAVARIESLLQTALETNGRDERERIIKFFACIDLPGCWNWKAARNDSGYSQFERKGGHRLSYEMFIGPIPEGLVIDHVCRNTSCVNPSHLRPLTDRDNILVGTGIIARNFRKSHCSHGHKFTPENTKMYKGARSCMVCIRARNANRYSEKRAAQIRQRGG